MRGECERHENLERISCVDMKSDRSLYRDQYNIIDRANPPKSMFTVEKACRKGFKSFIDAFHYHEWYELYYITEGQCIYQVANKTFSLETGDWIFIPPRVKHKNVYRSETTDRYLIYFSKDYINPCLYNKLCELVSKAHFKPQAKERALLTGLIERLLYEFQNPCEFSDEIYKSYLFQIMVTLLTKMPEKRSGNPYDEEDTNIFFFVRHTIEYIDGHFNERINLNELADMNYITPGYLSTIFKRVTGIHLSDYIQARRVSYAKKLLCETDASISEISEKCGFNDTNYFSTVFKKHTAMSPKQYRKIQR